MDRQKLSTIAHTDHPLSAPVSDDNAARLLARAKLAAGARILDLGCAEAAWLIEALTVYPDATATGVDISAGALARGRRAADHRRVGDRLELKQEDARQLNAEPHDLVLCVGSTHAFGGLVPTLDAVGAHVRTGGLALVGDGFWTRPPSAALQQDLGDEFPDLPGLIDTVEEAGWTPVYGHVSTDSEWDDYEFSWVGSLTRWALDHRDDPDAPDALAAAREHRDGWLRGYRGTLGFACLLLRQR